MQIIRVSDKNAISVAIKIIKGGRVIIFPTDTVYGFLADADNKKAVEKIFKLKKRLRSKPLPVFVRDFKMAKELAVIDKNQKKILKRYWPGKYTFVLKRKYGTKLYGVAKDTIALRIPKYKFLNDLLKKINKPLAQTSVNISGKPALTKIDDIIKKFASEDILIIDAGNAPACRQAGKSKPSKIIGLTGKLLTRIR